MAKKEFNDIYPKSIALTLRMLKPFFSSGRVLVADSWFGSVACALALFKHGIFCVMNVKTATKDFPKDELMAEVDEIKGKSAESRAARRARRGKQIAFTRTYQVGSRQVVLTAGGHNKKVPLLLIATTQSMLPGEEHVKTWQVNNADGTVEFHSLRTPQPQMHALYRNWMNVVDLHNKLRQGVVSMADIWITRSWVDRHFAEGLGIWEVNVYKSLIYFCPRWKKLSHGEFRSRLAWALMTLGKQPYPEDVNKDQAREVPGASLNGVLGTPALLGSHHEYVRHRGTSPHRCAYCGSCAYWYCVTCESVGLGCITMCGAKTARGRKCIDAHARGDDCKHATFFMSASGRASMVKVGEKRKRSNAGTSSSGGADAEDESEEP